jgi:hypothetical protein
MKWSIPSMMVARTAVSGIVGFYRTITFDQPSSDLTDFPVLIYGTYSYLATVANGGKVQNANGYDIRFYSDSGLTSMLKFERVSWDATTGACEFWVKIPTLTSASAKVIYLAYGDSSFTSDQQDAANTWESNFLAVWHLPTGPSFLDSTSNNNDGTNHSTTEATGKIGKGVLFDGDIPAYITTSDISAIDGASKLSVSAWVKPSIILGNRIIVAKWNQSGAQYGFRLNQGNLGNWGDLAIAYDVSGSPEKGNTGTNDIFADGVWVHIAFSYDGTATGDSNRLKAYKNGSSLSLSYSASVPATLASTTAVVTMGITEDLAASTNIYATMDEIRLSTTNRSADWVAAEYSNQNDPANFYTIGAET